MADPFKVSVDFQTSHLIFPAVIGAVLICLGVAIMITHRQAIIGSGAIWARTLRQMDKPRFFGTLLLTVAYFLLMVPVGDLWPNTGLGFLICSVPYVALTGILFAHDRGLRGLAPVLIVAVIVPVLVWWLFTNVFALTLP